MTAPPSGFEAFVKFLAADISADDVTAATGELETMWVESVAGHAFELDQEASIRGCYPGSFPTIDSYDDNFATRQGRKRAIISLKVVYCTPDGEMDQAWETQVMNKIFAHAKELSRFRGGGGNLLPKDGGDRTRVTIDWDDFDIAVLRVGVPKSVYKANTRFFGSTQRLLTDMSLGGSGNMKLSPLYHPQKKPIKTEVVPFHDLSFVEMPGSTYEVIKGASIHGLRPGTFKTIDKLNVEKSRVISYKSIDLRATSYEADGGPRSLNSVRSTLRAYIKALKEFHGASQKIGDTVLTVGSGDFTEKRLSIAIPMLKATELLFYKEVFEQLVDEAAEAHITLRVHRVA